MKLLRLLFGSLLIVGGLVGLFAFAAVKSRVLFLSGDGVVSPHSFLQLQILMIASGAVGCLLLWFTPIVARLEQLARWLEGLRKSRFLIAAFTGGAVVRAVVLATVPVLLKSDSLGYHDLAVNWVKTGGYNEGLLPTAYWPPGFPFVLSRVYSWFGALPLYGALTNALLGMGSCLLTYLTVRELWSERAARIALVLMALFPSQILFLDLLVSEHLFTFLLLAVYYLIVRSERLPRRASLALFAGGILLGLATLTRSLSLLLFIVLIPYWLFRQNSVSEVIRKTVLVGIGMLLIVAPWVVRNHAKVGLASVSSYGGINLYIGNSPGAGMGWVVPDSSLFTVGDPTKEAYNDSLGWALGTRYIADHPVSFLKRGVLKVCYLYAEDVDAIMYQLIEAAESRRTDRYVILAVFMQAWYLVVFLLALIGTIQLARTRGTASKAGLVLFGGTILYWTAVHFVFFASGRFHFPLIPLFCAFAGVYLASLDSRKTRGTKESTA